MQLREHSELGLFLPQGMDPEEQDIYEPSPSLSNGGAPAPSGPAAAESDVRVRSQSQASPASDGSCTKKPLRRRPTSSPLAVNQIPMT